MNTINKNIDTWNLLVKLRDTTKSSAIKEKCEMFLRQINTSAGNKVKEEANLFLDSCNALPVIYETGATSHAVNDLILFTDNTCKLAELRDSIYEAMHQMDLISKSLNQPCDWDSIQFRKLLGMAKRMYYKEFPHFEDHGHIFGMTDAENNEFCQLYLKDYDTWKSENGYK